ncbi:glucosaminidase domain-containing protein [Patescibacteria group bacterium]|nr:glucosaminidase domain-containing protein [Patescibacteria group bacterium]
MGDNHFLMYLQGLKSRFGNRRRTEKKNIKLIVAVCILGMGLFFYAWAEKNVLAEKTVNSKEISLAELDPLNRIDKGLVEKICQSPRSLALCNGLKGEIDVLEEKKIIEMVSGHPMEQMAPYLAKEDGQTASFLIAIAKKESNWGVHSPQKAGRDCYNYWGYQGSYKPTESGYSCFDSPEQAVEMVGGRIDNLIGKKIDTPAEMVIWKCGSDCEATGGQAAANKWIADVGLYYRKFN